MRAKQLITSVAESREGVGPGDPVEVAHAPSPVGEVEIRLDWRLGHRLYGLAVSSATALDGLRRGFPLHRLARGRRLGGPAIRRSLAVGRAVGGREGTPA